MSSLLQSLKASDNLQSLILLMGNSDAQKVVVAWTLYPAKWKDRDLKKGEDLNAAVAGEWEKIEIDFDKLVKLSGLTYRSTTDIFERMRDARLIYPNGEASENAMRVLRSEVGSHLQAKGPKR